jgi:hypothetical protein
MKMVNPGECAKPPHTSERPNDRHAITYSNGVANSDNVYARDRWPDSHPLYCSAGSM